MKYVLILTLVFSAFAFALVYDEEPNRDTWIWPGNGPYGSSTELRTNRISAHDQEIVIGWDITSIPVGSTVNTATIGAYCYDGMYGVELDIYRVTEDWDEGTLVNAIGHDNGTSYDQVNVTGSGWYEWDVTPLAQDWVDETEDNFGIVYYGTGGSGFFLRFYSRENGSSRPWLEIDYDEVGIESASVGEIKAVFK
ncbi:MAG: DNRLRE domain-containing protein [bacterium]|nr:DNRLRE domain-containing protein [bacterium]